MITVSDPDGIALLIVMGLLGIVLLLGALFVERLVEPRDRLKNRDEVAERKRMIAKRGLANQMRNHREYGL